MLGSAVGFDFSAGKVRAVEIRKGLRKTEIAKTSLDEAGLGEFVSGELSPGFQSVTGISSPPLFLRVLEFPFRDSRKIRKVYRFELESAAGFGVGDENVYDYHEVRGGEGTEVIVPAFRRDDFETYLESTRAAGLDPSCVAFSPVAFSSLGDMIEGERPLLLVDMDGEHLNFSFFDESGLRRARNCDDALRKVKRNLGLEVLDFGEIAGDPARKKEFFDGCGPITDEIRKTARYFGGETGSEARSFVLTGGACALDGIEDVLGESLGKRVERISLPQLGPEDSPFFARAYALALYGSSSGRGGGKVNFRRERYRPPGAGKDLLRTFRVPVALFAGLFLLVAFSKVTGVVSARSQISSLRSQMEKEIRQEFPDALGRPDPFAFSREKLESVRLKLETVKGIRGAHSPLEVLMAVSGSVPEAVGMTLDEIRIEDGGEIRIRGRCGSYNEIASIEKAFSESRRFAEVRREKVEKAVNDTLKFEMSMVVK